MFYYNAFGLNISSEIELPGMIEKVDNDKVDIKISFGEVNLRVDKFRKKSSYYVDHDDIYLWWEDIGKVKISNGSQIRIDVENSEEQIIPFLLGPVMALLLHQRGFLVLHGSSVSVNDGAIAFIGYKGYGKSTTAINLYKKGYPVVTDDILAIDLDHKSVPSVYTGYPHVRLSEDSYIHIKNYTNILTPIRTIAGKVFCDTSNGFIPGSIKLKKVYLLENSDQIRISTLNSQEILLDLLRHSFVHNIFKDKDQAKNLIQCAELIKNVNFSRLEVCHSFDDISRMIKILEADISIKK